MANEKRLIDAAELDRKLEALAKRYYEQGRMEAAKDYSFVQTVLLSAPTVDAVEVVRCKDCKSCMFCYPEKQIGKEATPGWYCKDQKGYRRPDDFCSYGERKDNGKTD